jgi:hypothetical protein
MMIPIHLLLLKLKIWHRKLHHKNTVKGKRVCKPRKLNKLTNNTFKITKMMAKEFLSVLSRMRRVSVMLQAALFVKL